MSKCIAVGFSTRGLGDAHKFKFSPVKLLRILDGLIVITVERRQKRISFSCASFLPVSFEGIKHRNETSFMTPGKFAITISSMVETVAVVRCVP